MAQGLNFQTHQFNYPTEGLQKALGAGSMFAQSLKSMQDFESEQAKLRMMQQEKDRQAKIDFANEQERAKNLLAAQALNQKAVKDDFGNTMYQALADQDKNAMVAKSDAELGFKGRSYADMFRGLDTSKWSQEQLAERDQLLAADADKNAQYTAGNKLEVQKRLNMLSGMSNEDAEKSAAEMLGLKADVVKSLLSGAEQQKQFGSRVAETMNSPLFMQSDTQALEAVRDKYGSTAQIESSIRAANEAESAARKKKHDQIEQKKMLRDRAIGDAEKDMLNKEIQILQFQMQNIGSPLERASYKESSGGGSKRKSPDQEYSDNLRSFLARYNGAPAPYRDEAVNLAARMKNEGKSPDQISAALEQAMTITRGKGDKEDKYAFNVGSLANVAPDKDYWTRKAGTSESEASMYAKAIQDKQAITDKMAALIGKKGKGVELEIANLQRQLSELERTPMQSARDAAYQAGLDFAKDYNIGDYGTKKATQDKVTQALLGPKVEPQTSGSKSQEPSVTSKAAPTVGIYAKTEAIYKQRENSDKYGLHMDKFEKDGSDRPAVGYGFSIADVNKRIAAHNANLKSGEQKIAPIDAALASKGGSIKDPGQRKIIDSITSEFINKSNAIANKNLAGLDTSNPGYENLVAAISSAYHQYGSASKVIKPIIENAKKLISQGQYQEAINMVHASPYGISHPNRAVDIMSAIESYSGQDLNVPKTFQFASKDAAKKYYQQLSGYLKKQGAGDNDTYKTMSALQKSIASQYGEGLVGANAQQSSAMSPRQEMLRILSSTQNIPTAPSADSLINKAYVQSSNLSVAEIRAQAQSALSDFNRYQHMHRIQNELRTKQMEADGKSPMQLSAVKQAGLEAAFAAAKTPKERLKVISDAQLKLNEQALLTQRSLLAL